MSHHVYVQQETAILTKEMKLREIKHYIIQDNGHALNARESLDRVFDGMGNINFWRWRKSHASFESRGNTANLISKSTIELACLKFELVIACLHQSVFKLKLKHFVTWLNATFCVFLLRPCNTQLKSIVAFLVYKPKYPLIGLWNVRLKTRTQPKVTHMGKLVFDIQDCGCD